jgi:N-dimethylarginine dimethylaminohydrolase
MSQATPMAEAPAVPAASLFPDGIGIDNQTGRLVDVLLGQPDSFRWAPLSAITAGTFAHMDRLGYRFDRQRALDQHARFVEAFRAADVRCHYLPADEGLPSSVFARDSSFMTPWGPVIAAIQAEPRRRDYAVAARFYHEQGIPIWRWVTAGYFEGGDFAIIEPGTVLLGYCDQRSTKAGADQVAQWMTGQGWEAFAVPIGAQFVHMDAVVVMLAPKVALVCEDALEPYALDWLKGHGIRNIPVSYKECVRLGGNVVCLGSERILSMSQNVTVNERLRAEGFQVTAVDYDMFTLGGGGVHCSSHELRRLPP